MLIETGTVEITDVPVFYEYKIDILLLITCSEVD